MQLNIRLIKIVVLLAVLMQLFTTLNVSAYQKYEPFEHTNYAGSHMFLYKGTVISCTDPVLLKIILQALKRVEDCGYKLPPVIVTSRLEFQYITGHPINDSEGSTILGDTDTTNYTMYINDFGYKYNTNEEFNTIWHECGHLMHFSNITRNQVALKYYSKVLGNGKNNKDFRRLKPQIEKELGKYATSTEFEFVAAYFASQLEGKDLSEPLRKLYLDLGGL